MRFKAFLEAALPGKDLKFEELTLDKLYHTLKTECSKSLWRVEEDQPLWRGLSRHTGSDDDGEPWYPKARSDIMITDTAAGERRSQNTSNQYTLILDNNPYMKDYPKRKKSLICTTSETTAGGFGQVYAVIPFDSVKKIASTNVGDLWNVIIKLWDFSVSIEVWNDLWDILDLSESEWSKWEEFQNQLIKSEEFYNNVKAKVANFTRIDIDDLNFPKPKNFLDSVCRAFSPETLGFSLHGLRDNIKTPSETWFSGKCVLISSDMWTKVSGRDLSEA